VALVTGAQQGIGEAMAVAFAAAGYDVAINWLDNAAPYITGQVHHINGGAYMCRRSQSSVLVLANGADSCSD
jgi:hypothetical protein